MSIHVPNLGDSADAAISDFDADYSGLPNVLVVGADGSNSESSEVGYLTQKMMVQQSRFLLNFWQ